MPELPEVETVRRTLKPAIGARIGKSRVYVTNFLRLLSLAPSVQQAIDEGRLSTGHGKVLASLAERLAPEVI